MEKTEITQELCYWCAMPTDEGEERILDENGMYDPKRIHDYTPCQNCFDKWESGFPCIEISEKPCELAVAAGLPPMIEATENSPDYYPTGRCTILTKKFADEHISLDYPEFYEMGKMVLKESDYNHYLRNLLPHQK